jgi:hypothetical protein
MNWMKRKAFIQAFAATSNKSDICSIWSFDTGVIKIPVLWYEKASDWYGGDKLFWEPCCLEDEGKPSKMAVLTYQCPWRHILQDWNPQIILVRTIMQKLYILIHTRYRFQSNTTIYYTKYSYGNVVIIRPFKEQIPCIKICMHSVSRYSGSVLWKAWWWLNRVKTCCLKNILCNKLLCLTKIYTLYELDKYVGHFKSSAHCMFSL